MVNEMVLWEMGFIYRPETKDYVLELWKNFKIRATVWLNRAKVWIQFEVVEGLEQYCDIVYLNSFGRTSLEKLIESYWKAYNLGLNKSN